MPGQVRMRLRYQGWATRWFDYLLVSKAELAELLEGSGWHVRKHIESGGPAYVAVMEKAAES